jgi:hypothetical protein
VRISDNVKCKTCLPAGSQRSMINRSRFTFYA